MHDRIPSTWPSVAPHFAMAIASQLPLALQTSGAQHALAFVVQLPPLMMHAAPASGTGILTACSVHCGVWLCVVMTHRQFLLWLQPELLKAPKKGLGRDGVRAIRRELEQLRNVSTLQPFASRVFSLVCERTTLDGKTVAGLIAEVRSELAPARERTVGHVEVALHASELGL